MKSKVFVGLFTIVLLFSLPAFANAALNNSIIACDEKSQIWYGSYADNYVDGGVKFGPLSNGYDSVVNSVYLEHDELNGVEVGWTWDRWADGSQKGPYMFTARLYNGYYSFADLGTCSKNVWYRWKIQTASKWDDDFDIFSNTNYKWTWWNNGWSYGEPHNGEEHQQGETRFTTHFKNMAKESSGYGWYKWETITFYPNDVAYGPWGNRDEWWTLLKL